MSPDVDRVVFSTEGVTIGAFRCATDHPSFRDSGPIRHDCFVFPRTAVVIQHEQGRPFVADPTSSRSTTGDSSYERRPVSPDGDRCDWFAVAPDILRARAAPTAIRTRPSAERPIRFTHASADSTTYLAQRRLFVDASVGRDVDPLGIEERSWRCSIACWISPTPAEPAAGWRARPRSAADLADAAKRWVRRASRNASRSRRIAARVGCSMFHLCRSFRRATGLTLHAYREAGATAPRARAARAAANATSADSRWTSAIRATATSRRRSVDPSAHHRRVRGRSPPSPAASF